MTSRFERLIESVCIYGGHVNGYPRLQQKKNKKKPTMNSCGAVEKELERVITKFTAIRGHSERVLNDVGVHFDDLKESINEGIKSPQALALVPFLFCTICVVVDLLLLLRSIHDFVKYKNKIRLVNK